MFSEGTLVWGLSIVLKPLLLQASIVLVPLLCIYIFVRRCHGGRSANGKQKLRAFLPAIVASQIVALLFSAIYIIHNLGCTFFPDFWDGVNFAKTQRHFAVLSTAPAIGILSGIALLKLKQSLPWRDLGVCKPGISYFQLTGLAIGSLLVVISCSLLWTYFTGLEPTGSKLVVETIDALGGNWGVYYAIFAILLSPILEEIFFRGILFSAVSQSIGIYSGLLVQAFIFAASHLAWEDFAPLFLYGIVLGYVYHKSGSLVPSMVIHILLSALVVLGMQHGL